MYDAKSMFTLFQAVLPPQWNQRLEPTRRKGRAFPYDEAVYLNGEFCVARPAISEERNGVSCKHPSQAEHASAAEWIDRKGQACDAMRDARISGHGGMEGTDGPVKLKSTLSPLLNALMVDPPKKNTPASGSS